MLISALFVNKHGSHWQFLFLIGRFLKKSSSLKPPGQINRNMVGSIYGRSCINYAHFVPIHYKHGRHRQFFFLIGRFLKIFSSKTELPNEPKLGRKRSIYGRSSTARTARFSKKSPWSVFFRGEMSVICHKITVKCR